MELGFGPEQPAQMHAPARCSPFRAFDAYLAATGLSPPRSSGGQGPAKREQKNWAPLFRTEHRQSQDLGGLPLQGHSPRGQEAFTSRFWPKEEVVEETAKRPRREAASPWVSGRGAAAPAVPEGSWRISPDWHREQQSLPNSPGAVLANPAPAVQSSCDHERPWKADPPPEADYTREAGEGALRTAEAAYLSRLSQEQRSAVEEPAGVPLLVLAGPGSGKTLFLASRIAHVLGQKTVLPEAVVAVTFTRRAATELVARVRGLLNLTSAGEAASPWVGTLHSFALRLLREVHGAGGISAANRVASDGERSEIARACLQQLPPDRVAALLQHLPPCDDAGGAESDASCSDEGAGPRPAGCSDRAVAALLQTFLQIRKRPERWKGTLEQQPELDAAMRMYNDELRRRGLLDVVSIISEAIVALANDPQAQRWAATHVQQLFIDEWQDTDAEQRTFLQRLLASRQAITAVGDDDQRIYAWRQASHKGPLHRAPSEAFRALWPSASVRVLGMNFRSSPAVVNAALRLISHNTSRNEKEQKSGRQAGPCDGDSVRVAVKETPAAEARWIAEEIMRLRGCTSSAGDLPTGGKQVGGDIGRPWSSFAVLVRTNAAAEAADRALLQLGVPTRAPRRGAEGGRPCRAQVLDLLAYLRLVVDPHHDVSFLRVYNVPRRKLGKAMLKCLRETFSAPAEPPKGGSPLAGLASLDPDTDRPEPAQGSYFGAMLRLLKAPFGLPRGVAKGLGSFQAAISVGRAKAREACSAADVARALLAETGICEQASPDARAAIQRLLAVGVRYAPGQGLATGAACVAQFLRDGPDAILSVSANCVSVSTMHAAKGLEWDTVFVAHCNEQVAPLLRQADGAGEGGGAAAALEEERRLFYVAMTRARDELVLSFSLRHDSGEAAEPSRFLFEAGLMELPAKVAAPTPLATAPAASASCPSHFYGAAGPGPPAAGAAGWTALPATAAGRDPCMAPQLASRGGVPQTALRPQDCARPLRSAHFGSSAGSSAVPTPMTAMSPLQAQLLSQPSGVAKAAGPAQPALGSGPATRGLTPAAVTQAARPLQPVQWKGLAGPSATPQPPHSVAPCGVPVPGIQPGWQAAGLQPGHRASALQSGQQAAGLQPGHQASGLQAAQQAAGLQPGQQALGLQPGKQVAGLQPGHPAAGLQQGQQAPGLWPGHQAPGLQPGQQALGLQSGQQAAGLQSGHQALGLQSGQQVAGLQSGHQAAGLQQGHQAPGLQPGQQVFGLQPWQQAPGRQDGQQTSGLPRPAQTNLASGPLPTRDKEELWRAEASFWNERAKEAERDLEQEIFGEM